MLDSEPKLTPAPQDAVTADRAQEAHREMVSTATIDIAVVRLVRMLSYELGR